MRYYRIENDNSIESRWFLAEPLPPDGGDDVDFWQFLSGQPTRVLNVPIHVDVQQVGPPLRFTLAAFDIPILHNDLMRCVSAFDSRGVQAVPVVIERSTSFSILAATRLLKCVDESASRFTRWTEKDGRSDKIGKYRMFTRMVINASKVGINDHIFRVADWNVALVVSETMRDIMVGADCQGIVFDPVS